MPEMTFTVQWPDGTVIDCYSPSLVVHEHLDTGARYPVAEFVERSAAALAIAGARVKEKFGFECISAIQQSTEIERMAVVHPVGEVIVLAMHPPLHDAGRTVTLPRAGGS